MKDPIDDLSIIQKTYDLIKWYVPLLDRLPRSHKFILGERMTRRLYDVLEDLVSAKYDREKLAQLKAINRHLTILRYQTRMLLDFELISVKRYQYASQRIDEIGMELGTWIKNQQDRENSSSR
jgi:23S rRNA-intervening sequence protein